MHDPTTSLVYQLLGCSLLDIDRAYWAARLDTDEWLCEARTHVDLYRGTERYFEWYEDLVCNEDVLRVKELWLLCPPSRLSPMGNTARLPIVEPGTAFDLKVASVSTTLAATWRVLEAHIIGRVEDKASGACTCFIWDDRYQVMTEPYHTNIRHFGRWRPNLPDFGEVAWEKMGVRL